MVAYTYSLHAAVLPKDKKNIAGTFPAISHWISTVILSTSNTNVVYRLVWDSGICNT